MTIDDVQKITNIFKKQPMPKHQLYFSQQQIESIKTEGEDIDLNKMTINGYPFKILEDPFQGGDNFVKRILKEFENASKIERGTGLHNCPYCLSSDGSYYCTDHSKCEKK